MTKKEQTTKRLNELRVAADLPPYDPKKVTMTVEELEELIHRLETPSELSVKSSPPTVAELLRKRNVIASHLDLPRLKSWKGSRDTLEKAITEMEAKTSHITIKQMPPKLAGGVKTRRALDTTKTQAAIKKMDKKQERAKIKEAKETAKKIAVSFGFKATDVFNYLQAKGVTRPPLSGEALAADIRAFIAQRIEALSKGPKKAPKAPPGSSVGSKRAAPGTLTPGDLATALQRAPRAIRIKLRSIEKTIPKAWRAEGRWAFHVKHKDDILKLLKGGKA